MCVGCTTSYTRHLGRSDVGRQVDSGTHVCVSPPKVVYIAASRVPNLYQSFLSRIDHVDDHPDGADQEHAAPLRTASKLDLGGDTRFHESIVKAPQLSTKLYPGHTEEGEDRGHALDMVAKQTTQKCNKYNVSDTMHNYS